MILDNLKPINFISGKFSCAQSSCAALVREAFVTHMSIKRLDYKVLKALYSVTINPWKKILKGKMENGKVNNWSIELSSHKLNIQYIKCTKVILGDYLFRLSDANLTDCNYEPKGEEFGCTQFQDLMPIVITEDSTNSVSVNVLETNT